MINNNLTDEQIAHNKVIDLKILFFWEDKKRPHEKVYIVDANKTVNIGGLSETGYMLRCYRTGCPTSTCITYVDLLRLAAGKTVVNHIFTIKAIL